jgi:hypothetical protein
MKKRSALLLLGVVIAAAAAVAACEPAVPHAIEGRADCISCHGTDAVKPYPKFHADRGYANSVCTNCHKVAADPVR